MKTDKWFKENGFTYIKQTDSSGYYFKVDKDGYANMIKWHYDDSCDNYHLKWRSWIGNNKERPKMVEKWRVPDRDIFLEAETDAYNIGLFQEFSKMMTYIKKNNDKMIGLCKDHINKRLKKLD